MVFLSDGGFVGVLTLFFLWSRDNGLLGCGGLVNMSSANGLGCSVGFISSFLVQ